MNRFASRFATILGAAALLVSTTAAAQTPEEPQLVAETYLTTYEAPATARPTAPSVMTRWQGTINLISNASDRAIARYDAHNAQALTVLDALKRGQRQVVHALLTDAVKATGTADIINMVELFKQTHGPIVHYTIQGTVPRSERTAYTFTEVRFADGAHKVFRMTWTNDHLVTVIHTQPLETEPAADPQDAAWQPMINWLSGADEAVSARYQMLNMQATRVLQGLRQNDTEPLHEALRVDRKDRGTRDITNMLSTYTQAYGPIHGYVVQGTLPRSERTAYTFVELAFANGEHASYRLVWLDDELVGFAKSRPLMELADR